MLRPVAIVLLSLALVYAPTAVAQSPADATALEAQVQEIERLAVTAHWSQSDAKIDALGQRLDALTPLQRHRLDYVRLRNRALAGDQPAALKGFTELLKQDLPVPLRVRVYTTATGVAANLEDWARAFTWLNDGLKYLHETPAEAARLLGAASYLHTLVGETGRARELALQALQIVENQDDPRALCLALSDVALAEDHAGHFSEAEKWRHRQIDACVRARDPIFIANGKYGVGKMAAAQGHHAEALKWGREALAEFKAVGFAVGAYSARLVIAESLVASNRQLDQAQAMLVDTLRYYREQKSDLAIAETERLLARLAE